jgi:hypothetical protein
VWCLPGCLARACSPRGAHAAPRSTLAPMSEPATSGPVRCNRCCRELDEPATLPTHVRALCPDCGSLGRVKAVTLGAASNVEASLATRVIASVVAAYTAAQYIVRPPAPEPGYHRVHDPHDVIGGGIFLGLAATAFVVSARKAFRFVRIL